jgi:hypothetical protein
MVRVGVGVQFRVRVRFNEGDQGKKNPTLILTLT